MRLSIVIPAHNEEHRIGPMLDAYLPFFTGRYGDDVEFLVVVNGSTDDTEGVIGRHGKLYPGLRVLVEREPVGKGGALMIGFREAKGDFVGFVDADGSTPPEAFHDLMDNLGDAGVIIASRWCPGAQVSPRQSLDRRLSSRLFNLIVRILFGLKLTDTQCGAKLMQRKALQAVLPILGITRWAFDVDLLFQLRRAGFAIKEIPTIWHDVAGSKVQIGKASTEMMLALARLRLIYSPFSWVVSFYNRFLAPWVHPAGDVRDYLLTHSLMLFIGAQFGNVCNLLFQVAMMRMLKPADFGVFSALLGVLMVVGAPLGALGGTITHFTAHFTARQDQNKIKAMMLGVGRDLLIPSALMIVAVAVWQKQGMEFLRLETAGPMYFAVAIIVIGFLAAVPSAVLTGVQAFEWAATVGNSWAVIRLVAGVLLVWAGLGVAGGLTAHLVGVMAGGAGALLIVRSILGRGWPKAERPVGLYRYLGGYMGAFAAYGLLSNADVVLVKHYFTADQAGLFAKAAMVARIVFFLPAPVAAAMFPKVTSVGESSQASRRTLFKALVLAGGIVGSVGVVCVAVPGLILRILAGGVQPGQVAVVRGMVVALAPLTLVMLLLNYEVAQRRFRITIPLVLCAAGYMVGVMRWHETPLQIVMVLGVTSISALALSLAILPWGEAAGGRREA
jgi:glycosyltransferase involved in cell wall biosynthesis/O-antigen/teichoic acid export membrane protein